MTILLLAETAKGALAPSTAKALTAAKEIGGAVHILVAGPGLKAAADQGHLESKFLLAQLLRQGLGVERDVNTAYTLYRAVADNGHASAQFFTGFCYEFGDGVAQDFAEATGWYRLAADQNEPNAQFRLGFCTEFGRTPGNGVLLRSWLEVLPEQDPVPVRCLDAEFPKAPGLILQRVPYRYVRGLIFGVQGNGISDMQVRKPGMVAALRGMCRIRAMAQP